MIALSQKIEAGGVVLQTCIAQLQTSSRHVIFIKLVIRDEMNWLTMKRCWEIGGANIAVRCSGRVGGHEHTQADVTCNPARISRKLHIGRVVYLYGERGGYG